MQGSADLEQFMLRLYQAFSRGDVVFLERVNSKERGLLTIGTDPSEWWEGYNEVTRIYRTQLKELSEDLQIAPGKPKAFTEGTVGWAADRPTFVVGGKQIPFRLTLVFHREDGEWKIVQMHASIGVANEEAFGRELTI